ncbi:hypothetical protein ACFQU7_34770 [Pseudoroseomonas wenyumeiae]
MSMIHDRKHAQKYLTRIGSGATLAFCCVEIAPRITLFHARRTSSPGGLKGDLKDATWAGQPALRKGEKTGSRLVAQGFLRLDSETLLVDSAAAEGVVEKRLRDYFRTGFGLSPVWGRSAVPLWRKRPPRPGKMRSRRPGQQSAAPIWRNRPPTPGMVRRHLARLSPARPPLPGSRQRSRLPRRKHHRRKRPWQRRRPRSQR